MLRQGDESRMPAFQVLAPADSVLCLRGADALDLLQRISASDLRPLRDGGCQRLLFTDDKGHLVDLPLVRREAAELWLLASPQREAALQAWIERWIITEDVQIQRPSRPLWLRIGHSLEDERLEFAADAATREGGFDELAELRLQGGIFRPRFAADFAVHPLEAGLRAFVSFSKGCYIGQEVIARMENYEKVRRGLAWLCGEGPPPAAGTRLEFASESGRVLDAMASGPREFLALVQAPLAWSQGAQIPVGSTLGSLRWVGAAPLNPA
jgi:folate-binding protein YgfZ